MKAAQLAKNVGIGIAAVGATVAIVEGLVTTVKVTKKVTTKTWKALFGKKQDPKPASKVA